MGNWGLGCVWEMAQTMYAHMNKWKKKKENKRRKKEKKKIVCVLWGGGTIHKNDNIKFPRKTLKAQNLHEEIFLN
jgi:hypothetical protein